MKKKSFIPWILAIIVIFFIVSNNNNNGITAEQAKQQTIAKAYKNAVDGDSSNKISSTTIEKLAVNGSITEVYYLTNEGTIHAFIIPNNESGAKFPYLVATSSRAEASELITYLKEKGIKFNTVMLHPQQPSIWSTLLGWLPTIFIFGFIYFFLIKPQMDAAKGKGGAAGYGKSKAKLQKTGKITFADVAGCDEAKADAMDTVEFLKNPAKFQRLGGKMPTGLLMAGPPGTGKTLMAKAMAGEAGVPFFTISGSEFVEMYVGVGASRVRDMFTEAKANSPCIIFIDEIDAVGGKRGSEMGGGGHSEREQTLNQLLVEMDGFEGDDAVVVIAATNRPDTLDPALLRPGRFDRQLTIGLPDIKGREEILIVHMQKKQIPLNKGDGPKIAATIARGTPGFSGADIANLVNEAAIHAAKSNSNVVEIINFEKAKDKILMGSERKGMVMSEKERTMTAYHEAGHAIIGNLLRNKGHDSVYKVSIVPRGRALGVTMFLPEQDKFSVSKETLEAQISALFGGRLAEEIIFGKEKISTGASNDIERATNMAEKMVKEWGFAVLGNGDEDSAPRCYTHSERQQKPVSGETSQMIDANIKNILDSNYKVAREILNNNMGILHAMTFALLKYETIDSEMVEELMNGTKFEDLTVPSSWTTEEDAAYNAKSADIQKTLKEVVIVDNVPPLSE